MGWGNWGGSIADAFESNKKHAAQTITHPFASGNMQGAIDNGTLPISQIGHIRSGKGDQHGGSWELFNRAGMGDPAGPPTREETIMSVLNEQLAVIKKRQGNSQLGTATTGDQTPSLASSVLFGSAGM